MSLSEKHTATWRGWEWMNRHETHIVSSKNHLFLDAGPVAVCGAVRPTEHTYSYTNGDVCKRCLRWAERHEDEIREID